MLSLRVRVGLVGLGSGVRALFGMFRLQVLSLV